ncbi:hypothetical protein [Actinocrispum wychmicini]|uniref:Uncharacterized protein n=1 Tax=Actinocrispum wychmicini TaxID=1213861 RepID=A0A4R2JC88_9PSEU|nr:hypothetical protein [Actinocrispum wychmicini]TCO54406.1 hypothetical protein EV192_109387 [Actinocrispum wychmicini]
MGLRSTPDVELLRSLTVARTWYEERFGWPVTVEVAAGRLVMEVGEWVDAVAMPQPLGRRVLSELWIAMLAGPVLTDATARWWMFLTRPAAATEWSVRQIRGLDVHLVPRGSHVVVPSETGESPRLPWIERPRALHQLPPWTAVIGAARRASAEPVTGLAA